MITKKELLVKAKETEGLCRAAVLGKLRELLVADNGIMEALDNLIEAKMVRFRVEMLEEELGGGLVP